MIVQFKGKNLTGHIIWESTKYRFYNIDRYELVKIVKEVGRAREKEYSKD